jgi:predicted nucleotidyltransferase
MADNMKAISPTPYTDVNEILNLLLANVKEILQTQFVGMYLYGSLSSGDFNPETSDIDFLVVTTVTLSGEIIAELEAMHNRTWATNLKRAGKLEGAYVPKELIRKHNLDGAPCPTINEGKFFVEKLGSDWIIQRHVVREYGVVIKGPNPQTLIDFVSPIDIRNAVIGTLHEWWFPMLADPTWLRNSESGDRAFAVITMCRVLHALEYGTIVSKPKAIQWAQAKLSEPWKTLIAQAIAVSQHKEQDISLNEILDFIRFTKELTMNSISPTPHSDVNEILNILYTNAKEILQNQFVGMYLFGSLANGDFDEHSDIDVLIVTDSEILDDKFSALKEMHERITRINSPWAIQLEVSYIPQNALRRFDPTNNLHPHMDRGNGETLPIMLHANDWIIQRHLLHERGVVITGPDLKTLIDPVSPDDMRQAIIDVLPLWVNPILEEPAQIKSRGYQSFVVLSLCRMLYTLQYGTIVSKRVAAQWGQDTLGKQWKSLIEDAWLGRQNPGLEARPADINETMDLIRYTLEYSKQIET